MIADEKRERDRIKLEYQTQRSKQKDVHFCNEGNLPVMNLFQ
jgi:hypothetical protein